MLHRAKKAAKLPPRSRVLLSLSYALFGGGLALLVILGLAQVVGYTVPQQLAYVLVSITLFAVSYYIYRGVRDVDLLDYFAIMLIPTGLRSDRLGKAADLNSNFLLLGIILVAIAPLAYTLKGSTIIPSLMVTIGALMVVLAVIGYAFLLRRV